MAFKNPDELQIAIKTVEPHDFVSHFLFEPVPYAFKGDMSLWISWKRRLAERLEVDPKDMVLTGSAAVGFSLNPRKGYKRFDGASDIDVGVVSGYHFELAWRYLRRSRPSWLAMPAKTRNALKAHRSNYVFEGAIATDMVLALLPFGHQWQAGLDLMSTIPPTVGRDVKLRIYRDYDALRSYQAGGIEGLRQALLESSDSETIVETEDDT